MPITKPSMVPGIFVGGMVAQSMNCSRLVWKEAEVFRRTFGKHRREAWTALAGRQATPLPSANKNASCHGMAEVARTERISSNRRQLSSQTLKEITQHHRLNMPPKKAARPAQENISLGPQVRDGNHPPVPEAAPSMRPRCIIFPHLHFWLCTVLTGIQESSFSALRESSHPSTIPSSMSPILGPYTLEE